MDCLGLEYHKLQLSCPKHKPIQNQMSRASFTETSFKFFKVPKVASIAANKSPVGSPPPFSHNCPE
jgi:hypothetical protein